tara:strand:- start:2457 stop:2612 length:156 start_codon:yes stop_codon:yes gene_type:complete
MKYRVGITIYNSFEIEANSAEEAENKFRELSEKEIVTDADVNIEYTEELEP